MTWMGRGDHRGALTVDCRTCPVAGLRCDDCMVTALIALPAPTTGRDLPLDPVERRAVGAFVAAGLLTPGAAAQLRARAGADASRAVG